MWLWSRLGLSVCVIVIARLICCSIILTIIIILVIVRWCRILVRICLLSVLVLIIIKIFWVRVRIGVRICNWITWSCLLSSAIRSGGRTLWHRRISGRTLIAGWGLRIRWSRVCWHNRIRDNHRLYWLINWHVNWSWYYILKDPS